MKPGKKKKQLPTVAHDVENSYPTMLEGI